MDDLLLKIWGAFELVGKAIQESEGLSWHEVSRRLVEAEAELSEALSIAAQQPGTMMPVEVAGSREALSLGASVTPFPLKPR